MKRRDFLVAMSGSLAAGAEAKCSGELSAPAEAAQHHRVIDTHLHLFNTHTKLPAHFGGMVYAMASARPPSTHSAGEAWTRPS